jgi:hypothetical protein
MIEVTSMKAGCFHLDTVLSQPGIFFSLQCRKAGRNAGKNYLPHPSSAPMAKTVRPWGDPEDVTHQLVGSSHVNTELNVVI